MLEEYRWRAATATGAEAKGVLEAASESAVVAQPKTGLNRDVTIPGFERGVATKDLAVFAQQFAGLIQAGLPLMRALALLAEQTPNRRLASALTAVQVDIESGASFSTALAAHPNVFPPLMVSLVSVGETGGVIAMITFVVPVFENMFASMGGELPLPTQMLV